MVKIEDIIEELHTGRRLRVECLWGNASQSIDFTGRYTTSNLIDIYGNKVYGGRGFNFQDENIVWRKIE